MADVLRAKGLPSSNQNGSTHFFLLLIPIPILVANMHMVYRLLD